MVHAQHEQSETASYVQAGVLWRPMLAGLTQGSEKKPVQQYAHRMKPAVTAACAERFQTGPLALQQENPSLNHFGLFPWRMANGPAGSVCLVPAQVLTRLETQ